MLDSSDIRNAVLELKKSRCYLPCRKTRRSWLCESVNWLSCMVSSSRTTPNS